jgi:hypothetical protein
METLAVSAGDFEEAWQEPLSDWVAGRLEPLDLRYYPVAGNERDLVLIEVMQALDADLAVSGEHRIESWEKGWEGNSVDFTSTKDAEALIPGYFGKHTYIRWMQRYIRPASRSMEYDMFGLLLDWVFDTRVSGVGTLYEFGCGTGHNLIRLRERHPDLILCGLDWASSSQSAVTEYAKLRDPQLFARQFDYFNPDSTFEIDRGGQVLTVASLEQVGRRYQGFVEYLLGQQVDLVVNIEPVGELLDPSNLIDLFSLKYFRKRGYLEGYLDYLRYLQSQGRIEILEQKRTYVGSLYIDGYSLIVWRPL